MGKMLKAKLQVLVTLLALFLTAATANAGGPGPCSNYGGWGCQSENADWCFQCGEVVDRSCHLVGDMNCFGTSFSHHGLTMGAAGTQGNPLVIDGNGYRIDGGSVTGRNCEVCLAGAGYCKNDPCRCADIDGDHECDGCIDSGILNANPDPNGNCQGGFSFVTIKNLEITGWCDGIFMSGTCHPAGVRLIGLLIEGNHIHDNGNGDCGTYNWTWTRDYYNDGIFLAEAGLPGGCDTADPNRVIIRDNLVYNQRGCIKWYCAGGNGINYCAGYLDGELREPRGCTEIANNMCYYNSISGIMLSYYAIRNRIHHNACSGNHYGGISIV